MSHLTVLMPGFVGLELPDWLARRLRSGLGGVCLFGTNVSSPQQLRELTDSIYAANPHAIIAVDEEGGDVSRLYQHSGSPFPGNAVLGRLADASLTESVGEQVGWELRDVGVSLCLAPDVDVNSNPLNPVIGVRSFGDDAAVVGEQGAAWVKGVQSTGVAASAKHFPGHGDTAQDSHVDLPTVTGTEAHVRERELAPFRAVIEAGTDTIMTSHIMVPALDPELPATFSSPILQGLLREEFGFEGVIVSDALDMAGASAGRGIPAAAVLAVAGGCDLLCIGTENTDEQVGEIAAALDVAIAAGELDAGRLQDAGARVRELGSRLANGRADTPVPASLILGAVNGLGAEQVAAAFTVAPHVRAALAEGRPVAWLRLEPAANIAVGASPWGPFGEELVPLASLGEDGDTSKLVAAVPEGHLPVIVGKDNHRHAFARGAIDALRERGDVIVVDMGWPEPTLAYADIATFGSSRLVGTALLTTIGN